MIESKMSSMGFVDPNSSLKTRNRSWFSLKAVYVNFSGKLRPMFCQNYYPSGSSLILSVIVLCCLGFQSCSTTKYLDQGDYLLDKNKIVLKDNIDDKSDVTYELSTFYRQVPNTNWLLLFPKERSHFKALDKENDSKTSKWWRKTVGEPPSIYSDSLTTITALDMQKHLRYNGYLNAKVIPQRDPRRKKMRVTYYALPGDQYIIDSLSFQSPDPAIDQLLQSNAGDSYFKSNAPLDLSLFNLEKLRITTLLKNEGYAEFYSSYIDDLELDTFQVKNRANLYINVLPPYGDSLHQVYFIGDINVYFNQSADGQKIARDTTIGGVNFYLTEKGFTINSITLRKAISLRFGEKYSQNAYDLTLDQLSELGMFRFVRIKQVPDLIEKNLIHFNIQLTPNYKMEFSADLDLNYINAESISNSSNLIGISVSPTLVDRNFLGGAELFSSSIHAGLEVDPSNIRNRTFWNTIDLGADFNLSLPKFVDYLGIWRKLYRIKIGQDNHLLNRPFYVGLQRKANTRASASYNYLEIFNWYRYNSVAVSYGFDYKKDNYTNYYINHFAINFLYPITEPAFDLAAMNNAFLARSFGEQIFVSLLFRDLNFVKRSRNSTRGRSLYFNGTVETAGSEILAINKLYNTISGKVDTFQISNAEISQYVRLEGDFRYLKQVSNKHAFAARFNIGIARPFGPTSDVPYVKQFFVGGANSMRAWAPRGLGPGGYLDPDPDLLLRENSFRLVQTGDFKMELNAEYRFPLFSFFHLALFVDVGNVWTFRQDDSRPGSQFLLTEQKNKYDSDPGFIHYPFYKQLGVSPGIGLRADLSYFIFRFDVGAKLRNAYPSSRDILNPPESLWWNNVGDLGPNDFGYNFGLGFPF